MSKKTVKKTESTKKALKTAAAKKPIASPPKPKKPVKVKAAPPVVVKAAPAAKPPIAKPSKTVPATPAEEAKKSPDQKVSKKVIQDLLAKGKKQGFLTYDEINEVLPEDMLSPDMIDETLMLFDDNGIEVVDEKQNKKVVKVKNLPESRTAAAGEDLDNGDYGSVTDPVKMYLREMGMVTLLSREGEVEIAKKIEAGEQEVLRALLEATTRSRGDHRARREDRKRGPEAQARPCATSTRATLTTTRWCRPRNSSRPPARLKPCTPRTAPFGRVHSRPTGIPRNSARPSAICSD